MTLTDVLEIWLGPLGGPQRDRAAVFIGAGFTKGVWGGAPLFNAYMPSLQEALAPLVGRAPWLKARVQEDWAEITHLVELYDGEEGRAAVMEHFLSEPGPGALTASPRSGLPFESPPSPFAESTYRTLGQWRALIAEHRPLHLAPLRPDAPNHLLGRLLAEGRIDTVLTTNWDAYIELGAALVGLDVHHAGDRCQPPSSARSLRVYDQGSRVDQHPRPRAGAVLLKLHGGVEAVSRWTAQVREGRCSPEAFEAALRRFFMVAASDLTHWRGPTQWVENVVADTLRAHATLFIGVSGSDTVTFRAVRERMRGWEDAWAVEKKTSGRPPGPAPLVAADYGPGNALACMFTHGRPGARRTQVVQASPRATLRGAYAWALAQSILEGSAPLGKDGPGADLRNHFERALRAEIDALPEAHPHGKGSPSPLVDILCDAIGPNLRWGAEALGRAPFEGSGSDPFEGPSPLKGPSEAKSDWAAPTLREPQTRWAYAPLGDPHAPEIHPEALLDLIAATWLLSRPSAHQRGDAPDVDPFTGVVTVPEGAPLQRRLHAHDASQARATSGEMLSGLRAPSSSTLMGPLEILPLPLPWRPLPRPSALFASLEQGLVWNIGRGDLSLGSQSFALCPVGLCEEPWGALPPRIPLPGGRWAPLRRLPWRLWALHTLKTETDHD